MNLGRIRAGQNTTIADEMALLSNYSRLIDCPILRLAETLSTLFNYPQLWAKKQLIKAKKLRLPNPHLL